MEGSSLFEDSLEEVVSSWTTSSTMEDFGIPYMRPEANLRRKFVLRNFKARLRWRKRKKKERNDKAIAAFCTPDSVSAPWTSDEIPVEEINEFCSANKEDGFLQLTRMLKKFTLLDHAENAQSVVNRINLFRVALENRHNQPPGHESSFLGCPLVWDTGASFGLTPFRADFIDYVECRIPVKDISKTNTVIGIGTTLHKYSSVDGKTYWLPCLSYHLPSADTRLFSPQVYHTLYGGNSTVEGDHTMMHIGDMNTGLRADVIVAIDRQGPNVPMLFNVSVTADKMERISPHINSALPRMERHTDFLGSYSKEHYADWSMDSVEAEFDHFSGFCGPCVASDANQNLSSAQEELLLWHWKLGISMHRIQELMREIPMEDPAGVKSVAVKYMHPCCVAFIRNCHFREYWI